MRDGFQTARSWAKRPVISWVAASSGNQNMRELPDTNATKMQECVVICTVGRQEWHGMAVNLVKIFCKRLSFMCPNSSKFTQHRLRLIIQLIRHCWGLGPIYIYPQYPYLFHPSTQSSSTLFNLLTNYQTAQPIGMPILLCFDRASLCDELSSTLQWHRAAL